MSGHYAQQAQAFVLRLPEHLEESVRARLKTGGMDGVQLTARPDGFEGLRECWGEGEGREGCVYRRGGVLHPWSCVRPGKSWALWGSSLCLFHAPPSPLLLCPFVCYQACF